MVLGFKTHINGKPTGFVPKILTHLGEDAMAAYLKKETLKQAEKLNIDLSNEPVDAAMKYYGKELMACEFVPKKLTIRDDPNNRWTPGRKIHFATGVRTKNYHCFAEGECKEVKTIVFEVGIPPVLQVYIDGKKLSAEEWNQLALDDGFDSLGDFNKFHWDWDKMPKCGTITKKIFYF